MGLTWWWKKIEYLSLKPSLFLWLMNLFVVLIAIVYLQSPVVAFTRCPQCGNDKKLTTTRYFHKEKRRVTPRLTSTFANAMKKKNTNTEPYLLADPMNNAIGNFFEDLDRDDSMSFIQCYMLAVGEIDGNQYGVGFPIDMPVMLTYFEGNELKPVRPDYPDYDHLINHVSVQMDFNECQLYKTPVVLTLQGEFEDEEMNHIPGVDDYMGEEDGIEYDEDGEEGEEISVEELILMEGIDDDEIEEDDEDEDDMSYVDEDADYDDDDEDYLDDEDEDEDDDNSSNENMGSFWSSSPAGKLDEKFGNVPDMSVARGSGDLSDVPSESFVTEEDTKSLRKAHRRADRIIEYAADVALIASFHHKKKNYHLVKLLEPIFIIGKRIDDIKGYYFTLLNDKEGEKIVPILEELLAKRRAEPPTPDMLAALKSNGGKEQGESNPSQSKQRVGSSRRSWRNRKK